METTIYLCRHADYENPKKIVHGRLPGFPLSEKGKAQAAKLAKTLVKENISAIYSSPLDRAYQTAEIIGRILKVSVVTDERLLEIKTPLEGKSIRKLVEIDGCFYQDKYVKAGGEALEGVFRRMQQFIREKILEHPGKRVVVVSHGDPIMCVRSMCLEGKLPKYYSFNGDFVAAGSGYVLRFEAQGNFVSMSPIFAA